MTTTVARHRTALTRTSLSRPLATALSDQLLPPTCSVFDYGCGRGDDLRHLTALGYTASGWDPTHRPDAARVEADIVNLGYVINVIEHPDERAHALRDAWSLARCLLVVSGRLTWDARGLTGRPLGDGVLTRTGTFQKFYDQAELASWIENTLDVPALAAAPGIFYVFRDLAAAQQFLSTRVHVYRPRVRIDPHELYEQHRGRLAPLLEFLTAHARAPRPGELTLDQEADLHEIFPRIARAVQLLHHVTDPGHWDRVAAQRRAELLIYIALSRFGRRPWFSQLPPTLATDIRTLFGTYQKACAQADRLLLAAGDQTKIYISARSSRIGKQTPSALYIHRDALAEVPPLLQVYEGCARVLAGTITTANMIKLSVTQPQVSYLTYPRFDRDAHPTLATAVTVNLTKLSVDWRDYTQSENPPLLHRKEEFLGVDDPRRGLYERLTCSETRAGLYEHPERIGTLLGWRTVLEEAGVRLRGHRLERIT